MKKISQFKIVKNLAILVFIVMPLFFLMGWLYALISNTDFRYIIETGIVYYLYNVVPVIIGGAIHQLILVTLPKDWTEVKFRIIALLSSPLIPIAIWIAWGGEAKNLIPFAVPIILVLIVYVFLMRKPVTSD